MKHTFKLLSKSVELKLDLTDNGKITNFRSTVSDDNFIPMTYETKLMNAISDPNIKVIIQTTDSDSTGKDIKLCVGNFCGSELNNDGTITATQIVNPRQAAIADDYYDTPTGVSVLHEVLEAYEGASMHPGASQANSNSDKEDIAAFEDAHNAATNIDPRVSPVQVSTIKQAGISWGEFFINGPNGKAPQRYSKDSSVKISEPFIKNKKE